MADGPVVETSLGVVRGVSLGGEAAAFHAIPYAAPPVGPLRWREAQPATPWSGVRDASSFGAICPQTSQEGPQDEDCLTLSVVTPDPSARGLPVLFSIHGGAFVIGSGRYLADKGLSPMVREGIVLVSANYRLGRFGFFAHPALTAEAGRGTGNFWLSDQIAALNWVRENIAAFGGDPESVTILGCSAGGSSTLSLMCSPPAQGLFVRAGVHSGGGLFNAGRALAEAEAQGLAFAARAGIEGEGPQALAALRGLSTAEILAADPGPPDFGAIIDGHLLPKPIPLAFAEGERAKVPLIVGSTSNEASIFGMMGLDADALRARFGIDIAEARAVYGAEIGEAELLRRVQTDFLFTSGSFAIASLAARSGPTWSYHFDYVPASQRATKPGASHCADMPYIFTDDSRRTPDDEAVAARLQRYWSNFLRGGNPNGAGLPEWPQAAPGAILPLLVRDEIALAPDYKRAAIEMWYAKWRADNQAEIAF